MVLTHDSVVSQRPSSATLVPYERKQPREQQPLVPDPANMDGAISSGGFGSVATSDCSNIQPNEQPMLLVTLANPPKRPSEEAGKPGFSGSEHCHDIKDGASWRAASVWYDGAWLDEQAVVAEAKSHDAMFIARWEGHGRTGGARSRSLHTRNEIRFVDVPSLVQASMLRLPAHARAELTVLAEINRKLKAMRTPDADVQYQ